MVERDLAKVEVVGSSPIARSIRDLKGKKPIFAGVAQLVERDLAKVEVVGSSPIARSIKNAPRFEERFLFHRKVALPINPKLEKTKL